MGVLLVEVFWRLVLYSLTDTDSETDCFMPNEPERSSLPAEETRGPIGLYSVKSKGDPATSFLAHSVAHFIPLIHLSRCRCLASCGLVTLRSCLRSSACLLPLPVGTMQQQQRHLFVVRIDCLSTVLSLDTANRHFVPLSWS